MKQPTTGSDDIVLRSSRKNEHKSLGEVGYSAFRVGDADRASNYYRDNTHLRPQDTVVATQGRVIAGAASALRLTMSDLPLPALVDAGALLCHLATEETPLDGSQDAALARAVWSDG